MLQRCANADHAGEVGSASYYSRPLLIESIEWADKSIPPPPEDSDSDFEPDQKRSRGTYAPHALRRVTAQSMEVVTKVYRFALRTSHFALSVFVRSFSVLPCLANDAPVTGVFFCSTFCNLVQVSL